MVNVTLPGRTPCRRSQRHPQSSLWGVGMRQNCAMSSLAHPNRGSCRPSTPCGRSSATTGPTSTARSCGAWAATSRSSTRSPTTSFTTAANGCGRSPCCSPPAPAAPGEPEPRRGGRHHRVHPYGDAAARRRRRQLGPAPRPANGERRIRQPGERARRRLPLLALVPDDGRARRDCAILDVLANATNTIAEGEVLQLMNCNNPDTGEADYMEVIYRKTAKLFEAGTRHRRDPREARRRHRASARDLRPASRASVPARRRRARLRREAGGARQEHRRRSRRRQAHAAADLRDGPRQRSRAAHDSRGDRDGRHAQPDVDSARDRDLGRAALHGGARSRSEVEIAIAALAPLPPSKFRDGLVELAQFAVQRRY